MTIKLDHINITAENLDQSIDWYRKVFGFKVVESGKTHAGAKWAIVESNDSMMCLTEYSGWLAADTCEDRGIHKINHFGIRVSNLEQWQWVIQSQNLKLYYGGVIEYPSSRSWYVHDPSGHEIEVSYSDHAQLQFPGGGAR